MKIEYNVPDKAVKTMSQWYQDSHDVGTGGWKTDNPDYTKYVQGVIGGDLNKTYSSAQAKAAAKERVGDTNAFYQKVKESVAAQKAKREEEEQRQQAQNQTNNNGQGWLAKVLSSINGTKNWTPASDNPPPKEDVQAQINSNVEKWTPVWAAQERGQRDTERAKLLRNYETQKQINSNVQKWAPIWDAQERGRDYTEYAKRNYNPEDFHNDTIDRLNFESRQASDPYRVADGEFAPAPLGYAEQENPGQIHGRIATPAVQQTSNQNTTRDELNMAYQQYLDRMALEEDRKDAYSPYATIVNETPVADGTYTPAGLGYAEQQNPGQIHGRVAAEEPNFNLNNNQYYQRFLTEMQSMPGVTVQELLERELTDNRGTRTPYSEFLNSILRNQ